jgi:hypothetical protein
MNMPVSGWETLAIAQLLCAGESLNELIATYLDWKKENPNVRIA